MHRLAAIFAIVFAPLLAAAQEPAASPAPPPIPGTSLSGATDVVHGGRGTPPGRRWTHEIGRTPDDRPWDEHAGVSLIDEERSTAIGVNAGRLKDGRAVIARGEHGEVAVEAGRIWTRGAAGAGIVGRNLAGRAHADVAANAVALFAGSRVYGVGDPRTLTWINGSAFAVAFAGAEANGDLYARAGVTGIATKARAGGFVGVKALSVGLVGGTLCGVSVNGRGGASAQAGLGGEASGTFRFDWATMSVSVGGELSATLGLGAGLGGEVEISLEGLIRDPRAAARCGGEIAESALSLAKNLCPWCTDDAPAGSNALRDARSRAMTSKAAAAAPASGAGIARD